MKDDQELIDFMRRREVSFLSSLESGPRVIERGGMFSDDGDAQHFCIMGLVARCRSQPRCGQDDDPPFIYMLTTRGRKRLAELRASGAPPEPPR